LQEMIFIRECAADKHKRGSHWQQDKLIMERSIRIQALIFTRWAVPLGMTQAEAARKLGLRPDTLARWKAAWDKDRLRVEPRGRPENRADVWMRNNVLACMSFTGPGVSVAFLQELFPEMARREIEDLVSRCRSIYRKQKAALIHALRWTRAGTVWAMDFFEPPKPVNGIFKYVLLVRDLGSGNQLWSQPVVNKDRQATWEALKALFLWWGPPLVIKSDNDGAFTAPLIRGLLLENDVLLLLSPPLTPEYNGSCEAGGGSIKLHAHIASARRDCPGEWNSNDIEAARLMANASERPWGFDRSTPDAAWAARMPITRKDRMDFFEAYLKAEADEVARRGFLPGIELSPADRASVDRFAIARACVAQGLLYFRRRRVSLRIKPRFWRKISS
jgi:transposase InsO family protein